MVAWICKNCGDLNNKILGRPICKCGTKRGMSSPKKTNPGDVLGQHLLDIKTILLQIDDRLGDILEENRRLREQTARDEETTGTVQEQKTKG